MKSIVFDLDGTLLYTLEDINDAINFALYSFNQRPNSLDETKSYVGDGAKELVLRSMYHKYDIRMFLKNTLFDQIYETYMDKYLELRMNKTRPYDGIVELLNSLKEKGYKLGVLSNKPDRDTKDMINHYFPDTFDVVLGARENVALKPDAKPLLDIIDMLGSNKEDTIYVGDSLVDIYTCKNANVKCISASYGYCSKDILSLRNDIIVDKPLDILEVI